MTAWGCRPEARDKPESKLNADRVSLVSCFAKLNKRIVPTLRLISARRHGMEGEESSWIQKKKKKTIDARWPARRSGLSIPLGNTSSGEINHRLRYRERMKEERKRRETNQTKRQRKGSLLFVERKEKESSREGRIERRRIRENSWGRGKIWKSYKQRRHESGYNKIKEEEEEIRRGYPEREERYASWTSLL